MQPIHGILSSASSWWPWRCSSSRSAIARWPAATATSFWSSAGLAAHLALVRLVTVLVELSIRHARRRPPSSFSSFPMPSRPWFTPCCWERNLGLFSVGVYEHSLAASSSHEPFVLPYLVMSVLCGLAAVLVTRQVRKRGRLLRAGFYAGGGRDVLLACSVRSHPALADLTRVGQLKTGRPSGWRWARPLGSDCSPG